MGTAVLIRSEDREVAIPTWVESLESFRRWALSEEFPQHGRIDYIDGAIEVDMSPSRLTSHGDVKVEIGRVIANRVLGQDLGKVYIDQTRVSCVEPRLSCEPDILVLLHETVESGRITFDDAGKPGDPLEIEGGPDLVVEVVSRSSVTKDTRRLPVAYFGSGVREYWLVDARGDELSFRLLRRGEAAFEETPADAEGFLASRVLGRRYRLDRIRGRRDEWRYDLREAD